MADRSSMGPPGTGGGPVGGRKGFFTRNPFVIAILAVLLMLMVSKYLNNVNQVELGYSAFVAYVESTPLVAPPSPEGPDSRRADTKPAASGPDASRAEAVMARMTFGPLTITPQLITGKIRLTEKDRHDFKIPLENAGTKTEFKTQRGSLKDEALADLLKPHGIPYTFEPASDWSTWTLIALPTLLLVTLFFVMFRSSRMTGENVLSFGRSRAKIVGEDKTGVTFEDVAGADEAKEELKEIVEFLKEPDRFTALGGKIPRGVLLVGAPGCGKTLLARAVAGEAGVPFFSISGSDFVEMFVGVGAARVRDLFTTAKQKAPCIIFVDEIDAVGRHRGAGLGGGHDEREQTLNQLLVEMDGFDTRKGVIILAATNRPDILDPALLRPGRFDRHVVLDAPDVRGREAILRIHSRGKPLAPDVDLTDVARRTPGFTGADLSNVMNEGALLAARRRRKDISRREVEEAVERVVAGPERRSRVIGPREKRILAYHELGHALVAKFTPDADPVAKVSIIPRGKSALGYTLTLPAEDRYIVTREQLLSRIRSLLGGRTAEELVFDHQSTGAEDDLQKVTQLARALVCRFGMTDALGPITYDRTPENPFLGRESTQRDHVSDRTADLIDGEVRKIVDACHAYARRILMDNRDILDSLAQKLIEVEVLSAEDFEAAIQKKLAEKPPVRAESDGVSAVAAPERDPSGLKPAGA